MKRLLFRFLPAILMVAALLAASIAIYSDLQKNAPAETKGATVQLETYPSVLCTNGSAMIVKPDSTKTILREGEKVSIITGDIVKTLTSESSATVFWSEGSVTRLSGKSSIDIKGIGEADKKQIEFSLLSGKTYSRIFEYLRDDESFKEYYADGSHVASVRGTAFEVNADAGYVKTFDHVIEINDLQKKSSAFLAEGKAVLLSDATKEAAKNTVDSAWEAINSKEDREQLVEYTKQLQKKFAAFTASFGSGGISIGSGSQVSLGFDPAKIASWALTPEQTKIMKDFYYHIASLDIGTDAKQSLRAELLQSASGSTKETLEEDFARHSLYDLAAARASGDTTSSEKLRAALKSYQLNDSAKTLLDSLGKSMDFNIFDILSTKISNKITPEQKAVIEKKIDNFNTKVDTAKQSGKEFIDKAAKDAASSLFDALPK